MEPEVQTQPQTPPSREPAPQMEMQRQTHVNWGGVIKGALIVGAVVLVAAVAWSAIGAIAATQTGGTLLTAGATGSANALGMLETAGKLGLDFITGVFGKLGLISAAAPAAVTTASTGAVATVTSVAAGGLALKAAWPHLTSLHLVDHSYHAVPVTPPTDNPFPNADQPPQQQPQTGPDVNPYTPNTGQPGNRGGETHADAASGFFGNKSAAAMHGHANPIDPPDMPEDHSSHHAAEQNNHRQRAAREMLSRTRSASEKWTERVSQSEKSDIKQRNSSYMQQAAEEQAQRDQDAGSDGRA